MEKKTDCCSSVTLLLLFFISCFVDFLPQDQETPLHTAASRGHLDSVQSLIEVKCDLDEQDKWGNTALHLAIKRKYSNVAMMLLQAGADFDIGNCVRKSAANIL